MHHASKYEFNMAIRDTYGVYRVSFNNGAPFQYIKYKEIPVLFQGSGSGALLCLSKAV